MKKSLKKLCVFTVSLMAVVTILSGCAPKKDLTGKWNLKEASIYGYSVNAADYQLGDGKVSDIGFEILDAEKAQFNGFSKLFDSAADAVLTQVGLTKDQVEMVLPAVKSALEEQGIDTSDIEKTYNDFDKLDYSLSGDKFAISTDGQNIVEGTLVDDNTISVPVFGMKDLVLTFTR